MEMSTSSLCVTLVAIAYQNCHDSLNSLNLVKFILGNSKFSVPKPSEDYDESEAEEVEIQSFGAAATCVTVIALIILIVCLIRKRR